MGSQGITTRSVDLFERSDFIRSGFDGALECNKWLHDVLIPDENSGAGEIGDYLWAVFIIFNHEYYGDGLDMRRLYVRDFLRGGLPLPGCIAGITCPSLDGSPLRQEVHINCSGAVLGKYRIMFDDGDGNGVAYGLADTLLHEMAHMRVMNIEADAGVELEEHGTEFEAVCEAHGLVCEGGATAMSVESCLVWLDYFGR